MTITNPMGSLRSQTSQPTIGPAVVLAVALTAVLAFAEVLAQSHSRDAVLPAAAALLFAIAAAVALIGWRRPAPRRQFTYWDAAGVLTLVGLCVSAAVEPEQMVRLVAGAENP